MTQRLTEQELNKLSTQRLLGHFNQVRTDRLSRSYDDDDGDDGSDYYFDLVKEILGKREHVKRKGKPTLTSSPRTDRKLPLKPRKRKKYRGRGAPK